MAGPSTAGGTLGGHVCGKRRRLSVVEGGPVSPGVVASSSSSPSLSSSAKEAKQARFLSPLLLGQVRTFPFSSTGGGSRQ